MTYLFRQGFFVLHSRYVVSFISSIRKLWLGLLGMKVGKSSIIGAIRVTWPHKVVIGDNSIIEQGVYFNYDGIYTPHKSIIIGSQVFIGSNCEFNISGQINIGNTCLIASGCKFIDHDHGSSIDSTMNVQKPVISPIKIEDDVWLGFNVVVLKGVTIGKGAIVAACSVITKDVGEYEVVAGIPAKFIRKRN